MDETHKLFGSLIQEYFGYIAKKKELQISSAAEYLTYIASTGENPESFEMRYEDENIWLTQRMMASLYEVDVRTINDHIQKIYDDGELTKEATIRNFRIVQTEENRQVQRNVMHYNLQLIISVGFTKKVMGLKKQEGRCLMFGD